ncbi:MAG: hypothetical protein WA418_23000 [Bradyrhizobium sp.]
MPLKHARHRIILPIIAREKSMSSVNPLVQLRATPHAPAPIVPARAAEYAGGRSEPARSVRARIERSWHAVGRVAFDVQDACPHLLLAIISFVISEFLQGCAAYAQAMHPIQIPADPRDELRQEGVAAQDHDLRARRARAPKLVSVASNASPGCTVEKPKPRPA